MLDEQSMDVLRLWSLGVGSVIGGDFFGWNSCLRGGFGAGVLSILWAATLYFLMARCIGRLCTLLPKAQGSYSFVTIGMGPLYGTVVAACELVKLFWVLCALAFGIVEYILEIVHVPHGWQYLVYALLLATFFGLGLVGVKNLGNSQIFVTIACLMVLSFYWVSVSTNLDFHKNAVPEDEWFRSWDRVLESLPFGAWFFLGFEELPLLVPHSLDVQRRAAVLRRGLRYSFLTVLSSCVLTFLLASGSKPGVPALKSEEAPLVEGVKGVYGDESNVVTVFAIFTVLALLAPFCSFFLYCTYHIQEIAEAGMIPHVLAKYNHRLIPTHALCTTAITTFVLLCVFALLFGIAKSAEVVIPGCLVAAMISAFLQLEALKHVQDGQAVRNGCCVQIQGETEKHLVSTRDSSCSSSNGQAPLPVTSADISLLEIRSGQSIIVFILLCIIVLACRNLAHRIGLSIVVVFLLGLIAVMRYTGSSDVHLSTVPPATCSEEKM